MSKKTEIKKVLLDMDKHSHASTVYGKPFFMTPYLERIMEIVEGNSAPQAPEYPMGENDE